MPVGHLMVSGGNYSLCISPTAYLYSMVVRIPRNRR